MPPLSRTAIARATGALANLFSLRSPLSTAHTRAVAAGNSWASANTADKHHTAARLVAASTQAVAERRQAVAARTQVERTAESAAAADKSGRLADCSTTLRARCCRARRHTAEQDSKPVRCKREHHNPGRAVHTLLYWAPRRSAERAATALSSLGQLLAASVLAHPQLAVHRRRAEHSWPPPAPWQCLGYTGTNAGRCTGTLGSE
jgi:hypothetical protein